LVPSISKIEGFTMTVTPLPRLAGKLRELTGQEVPGYRKLYLLALDGSIPIETRNGRLFVRDADLPQVAALLGLKTQ
jgi:hypothetical protein